MILGGIFAGGGLLDGEIRDLRATESPEGVQLRWEHVGAGEDDDHLRVVLVDGDAAAVLPPGVNSFDVAGLDAGQHRFDVRLIRGEASRVPDLHGEDYGRRAWLSWPAATDADVRAYLVFTDGGSGTVSYAAPAAVVDRIEVHEVEKAAPSTGTGSGRLTVFGAWSGAATNTLFSIEVNGGEFRHNLTGAWSAWQKFAGQRTFSLPWGVQCRFEDDAADYDDGDVFRFRVGPRCFWTSGILEEGTHKFSVKARDAAGNVGDALAERAVAILYRPEPVTNFRGTWDGTVITLTWELPAENVNDLRLFGNYNVATGLLEENVITSGAMQDLASNVVELELDPEELAGAGVYRFFLQTVDGAGRLSDSLEMVELDTTAIPTGTKLNEPEAVTVTPAAGGTFVLSWQYRIEDGAAVSKFAIYANADPEALSFDVPEDVVDVALPGRQEGTAVFTWTSGAYVGTQYFTVRARNSSNVETTNVDVHEGIPDAAAPDMAGDLTVVPN